MMDERYEELLKENAALKRLNKELSAQIYKEDVTQYPWMGNLGHWYWDFPENKVTFNPLKAEAIGYRKEHLPEEVGFEFFTEKIHPEDYEDVMDQMRAHLRGEVPVWEVKYRIQAKDGTWKTFYDRGKVTQRNAENKPLFLSGIVFDITESERSLQEEIKKSRYWQNQAQYDHLTQLYSRYELERQIKILDESTCKSDSFYTFLLFDVDCFKNINDTHGHLMGDYVLSQMGAAIENACRSSDITGRYGGDEFLIALPDTTKEQALNIARRIQSELKNIPFPSGLKPSISGGIATSAEASEIQKLISLADERLYLAKKNGRSQIVIVS